MSIINNMHKDLDGSNQVQPVLSGLAEQNKKQKALLFVAITFFVVCSIVLLLMIFFADDDAQTFPPKETTNVEQLVAPAKQQEEVFSVEEVEVTENRDLNELEIGDDFIREVNVYEQTYKEDLNAKNSPEGETHISVISTQSSPPSAPVLETKPKAITRTTPKATTEKKLTKVASTKPKPKKENKPKHAEPKQAVKHTQVIDSSESPEPEKVLASGHLSIESAELSDSQIANIYLKEANKAQQKGDNELAAEKWQKALNVKPDLNEVRKSLAMYHYSQNEVDKTSRLLKKGALISPEYSDFNLMLSRIALKNNEPQKAFLYLEQNPPEIEGNLDYYISHAILAQKFKMYERSESLYSSLLTQRPNNGRWLMSLAISQDRQGKKTEAIASYQNALTKVDLSTKAKDYINKRLAFLSKE